MGTKIPDQQDSRTISSSVAGLVAFLEMRQERSVTVQDLARVMGVEPGSPRIRKMVHQLTKRAWLRPLPLRGAYEFMPAAGEPWASGDPWLELRVARQQSEALQPQVALGSAAFLRRLTDRRPARDLAAVNAEASLPPGMRRVYTVIRTAPNRLFGADELDGIPVATAARLVLEAVMWWQHTGDLRSEEHWVRPAAATADLADLEEGARRLGPAITARAGYLAERIGAGDAADRLHRLPLTRPVVFGARPRSLAGVPFDHDWGVYDTLGLGRELESWHESGTRDPSAQRSLRRPRL